MNWLVYVCYPLLGILLLSGACIYKRGEWNEEFMSLSQTKALQGFCAVCVMLHHIGQKTCASWLPGRVITHGLDVFVPVGYFFVGIFLFCSGYGLYKSYKEKTDYLQGFFERRFTVPVLGLVSVNFLFLFVRYQQGEAVGFSTPFHITGPLMSNGYAWFIYALLLLYLLFYLAFRFCKKESAAISWIGLAVVLYIIHCDWWMYGNWWYNSVILFVVGLIFARHEEKSVTAVKKHYVAWLVAAAVSTAGFFVLSEYVLKTEGLYGSAAIYSVVRWAILISQMLAAWGFVWLVLLLGMKVRIGNKVLGFLGALTLEIYLVHGLFLQIFGYKENLPGQFYIKSVPLLVLVIAVCTVITAFFLHQFYVWAAELWMKQTELRKVLWRDAKKLLRVILVLVLVFVIGTCISAHRKSAAMEEKVEAYARENITYAEVDGVRIAAYVAGEGEHTVVLLRGFYNPCPTITLRTLADELAVYNRVIILDYPGCGFSDDTDKERTAENLVSEIHDALKALGEESPYILAGHQLSGLYTQLYAEKYPEEVEAIIGLDASVAAQPDEMLAATGRTPEEYRRILKKQGLVQYWGQKCLQITGFSGIQWEIYAPIFKTSKDSKDVLKEMFISRTSGRNTAEEMAMEYDSHLLLSGKKYAENMPVLQLLSNYSYEGKLYVGSDWRKLHEDLCTNTDIQMMTVVRGDPYFVYRSPEMAAEMMQEFIDGLN